MRSVFPLALAATASLLGGCATLDSLTQRQEAEQLAWTGPGAGPCLWGGVSEAAAAHCAEIAFGLEGQLESVNRKVGAQLGNDHNCVDHVEALRAALAARDELRLDNVYSCPLAFRADGTCHVSLLVTGRDGARYVVDNGAVIGATAGSGGVATFAEYASAVQNVYWVGLAPTWQDVAEAFGGAQRKVTITASGR